VSSLFIGLVAFYEWFSGLDRTRLRDTSPIWGRAHRGAAATTLVAGTAIAPFALYHFHRMTHYGLVANLIAAPLVSVLIMPMAVLSLAVMPFGLEFWPLQAMGVGIDLMVATGEWVASWPGAVSSCRRFQVSRLSSSCWGACGSVSGRRAPARSAS
jgi:competence protein ComEC